MTKKQDDAQETSSRSHPPGLAIGAGLVIGAGADISLTAYSAAYSHVGMPAGGRSFRDG